MSDASARAQTATVVVVAPAEGLADVEATLAALAKTAGVRPIIVTLGDQASPQRTDRGGTTVIEGIVPRYLNNAVASLRLSSLQAVAWWREPATTGLSDLADLVDRVVLDVAEPVALWERLPDLAGRTGVSDVRWARLTRWRDLFAQFFDLPDVRDAAGTFSRFEVSGGDPHAARLFAGWVTSRLPGGDRLEATIRIDDDPAPLRSVRLSDDGIELSLRLLPNQVCLETTVRLAGAPPAARVVSAGDSGLAALMSEELRVRSRDLAFEDAVAAAVGGKR